MLFKNPLSTFTYVCIGYVINTRLLSISLRLSLHIPHPFYNILPPQYFLHLLPLRQFLDQLVQVSGLPCYGIFKLFYAVTTDEAGDEMRIGM